MNTRIIFNPQGTSIPAGAAFTVVAKGDHNRKKWVFINTGWGSVLLTPAFGFPTPAVGFQVFPQSDPFELTESDDFDLVHVEWRATVKDISIATTYLSIEVTQEDR